MSPARPTPALLAVLLAAALGGCAVGPDYVRPESATNLPAQFAPGSAKLAYSPSVASTWWTLFGDRQLDALVDKALANSPDALSAAARVEEADAVIRQVDAALLPQVDATAAGTHNRISQTTATPLPSSVAAVSNNARLALTTSFELDVWGKLRRASEAARAQALGSRYGRDTVALSIAGLVTQGYLNLRALDAQRLVTAESVASAERSLKLTQVRFDGGIASQLDVQQAESAYALMMEGQAPYIAMVITYPSDRARTLPRTIPIGAAQPARAVTLGIIGAGNHVKAMLLPPLQTMKSVAIQGICTASGITAKTLAGRIGAGYCTSDHEAILNDGAINAVLIGTRHDSHAALVVKSLLADKHVFVEKPLCLTEDELQEIRATYEKKAAEGLQLVAGFNRRFSPHAKEARAFFASRANPLVMLMNKQKYENLSAELKAVIDKHSGLPLVELAGNAWDTATVDARKRTNAAGNKTLVIKPEDYEAIRKASASVELEWAKEVAPKGLDGAALIKQARAIGAQHLK